MIHYEELIHYFTCYIVDDVLFFSLCYILTKFMEFKRVKLSWRVFKMLGEGSETEREGSGV